VEAYLTLLDRSRPAGAAGAPGPGGLRRKLPETILLVRRARQAATHLP
jgi:hypothetical protein